MEPVKIGTRGANVIRLVAANERHARHVEHAKTLQRMEQTSMWFEKQYTSGGGAQRSERISTEIAQELRMASKSIKLERQARLKFLMQEENLQYEAELNSMGLAISKDIP